MQPNETMDQLIETKLTKTEAIDLIVEEMKDEVAKQRSEIDRQIKELKATITVADVLPLLKGYLPDIEVPSGSYRKHYSVSIRSGEVSLGKFSPEVQKKLARITELTVKQEELGKKMHELNDGKTRVRNAILKTMLEGSDKGKQFLQLLGDLKLRVSPKLTQARKLLEAGNYNSY